MFETWKCHCFCEKISQVMRSGGAGDKVRLLAAYFAFLAEISVSSENADRRGEKARSSSVMEDICVFNFVLKKRLLSL